ncbi:MAG: hypothetical protein QXU99_01680 [Candidatus Bathyarchaeia archaeon]
MSKKALSILAMTAVMILCFTMAVNAAKPGYGFTIATGADITSWEGTISPANEWDDSYKDWLYNGWTPTTSFFRCKWGTSPAICENWLIEFLGDTTNDAGDYWEICVDTMQDGGAAPNTDDFKVNWSSAQGVKVWKGTGSGWTAFTAAVVGSGGDVYAGTSISASPASSTPHRIVEIYLNKGAFGGGNLAMQFNNNERIAIYDAASGQTLMWPPYSSGDQPDTYGAGTTDLSGTAIPEGLTISVMLAASCVTFAASARYFRKLRL